MRTARLRRQSLILTASVIVALLVADIFGLLDPFELTAVSNSPSNGSYAEIFDRIEAHRAEFGRAFLAGAESALRMGWDRFAAAQRKRAEFNRWCQRVFERYDLLLTPTLPSEAFGADGPPPREIDGKPLPDLLAAVMFTYPFNMSGHPAASVRAGFTDAGLPCGLQIVAERHRDDLVLQAAYAYERARPWDKWPEV